MNVPNSFTTDKPEVMWNPKPDSGQKMKEFFKYVSRTHNVKIDNLWDLHRWSVDHFRDFWGEIWKQSGILHSKMYDEVFPVHAGINDNTQWFTGARLNYAENILRYRDDHIALILTGEERQTKKVTYAELYDEAKRYGASFRRLGLKKGDHVACYMNNRVEPVYAMLGATSIGAIWSGALPLLGAQAAINRFMLTKPKFLFTTDSFIHDGEEKEMLQKVRQIGKEIRSLEKIIIVPSEKESMRKDISRIRNSCFLDQFLSYGVKRDDTVPDLEFEQLPLSHPVNISYTSGTTGSPKALAHGAAYLLSAYRDFVMHISGSRSEVLLSVSPVGWATWNFSCVYLSFGCKVILYDGVPFLRSPTYLWDMVDEFGITNLFLTPSTLDDLEKKDYVPTQKHQLSSLKSLVCASSVVKPRNYDFVYKKIKKDIIFGSAYGSTELMGAATILDRTLPVYRGEMQTSCLGISLKCYNESGESVVGSIGELVIDTPIPNLPMSLLGDRDGSKLKETYFKKYPGAFATNDLGAINPATKGIIIYGRSDDTLKPKGARIGCVEIYNVVNTLHEVQDSLCASQYNLQRDERVILFIKMEDGYPFTKSLVIKIRHLIETELSKRHIPEVILETKEIPRNMNGKKMEILVKKIINNMPYNTDMVLNPESLQHYMNIPELRGYT